VASREGGGSIMMGDGRLSGEGASASALGGVGWAMDGLVASRVKLTCKFNLKVSPIGFP
jgi:hypothetical protein